jgi:putative endonuclease
MTQERRSLGHRGEELAVSKLKELKYRILERNYRCALGEIDIIAREKEVLVFVEVKTRRSQKFGHPADALHEDKQRKLSKVALTYLNQKKLSDIPARFDVVVVEFFSPSPQITLIRNAFDLITG